MPLWYAHFVYVRGGIVYCRLSGMYVHGGQKKMRYHHDTGMCVLFAGTGLCLRQKKGRKL
jgi:hypothetical protein